MANRITTIFEFNERGQGLKKIKADMAEVDGSINKAKVGVKGLWAEFKGSRAAQAAVAGIAAKMAVDAVNAASNLQESVNAVNVTFGEASEGIGQLADDAVDSYGLSERAFNDLAVAFSGFATQIAGEGGDVVAVVDDMATRVADFASVHNLEMSDAMTKFQSALAGEAEAMRRYGIDVSAATVKMHAYEMGIADVGDELTESEKVQARYSLLMQETEQWADDFANTSDSLANTQKKLAGNLENTQATLGEQLLPAAEAVTSALNELAGAMETVDGITMDLTGGQAGLGDAIGAAVRHILNGNQALGVASDRLWGANDAVKAYDKSLSLTDAELQRSIDILNEQAGKLDETTESTNDHADATKLQDEFIKNVNETYREQQRELERSEEAQGRAAEAAEAYQDSLDRQREAIEDLNNANLDMLGGDIAVREAKRRSADAMAEFTAVAKEAEEGTREYEEAADNATLSLLGQAEAATEYRIKQMEANGETATAAEKAQIMQEELGNIAAMLGPGNPLFAAIQAYIDQLNNIPRNVSTTIRVGGQTISVGGGGGNVGGMGGYGTRARGGPVSAGGTYLVGEEGPELLHMGNQSGSITPNDKIGVGGNITVNIMGGYVDDRTISELERRLDQWRRGAR